MKAFFLLLIIIFFFFSPQSIFAQTTPKLPTVSVINEIRGNQLGLEKADLLASLKEQESVTRRNNIRATWLWQYSALEKKELIDYANSKMSDQEFGLFLEIDKNTAEKAGVQYKGHGPWYHSDGLLLVSYDQSERRKLIDLFFEKFKEEFGYYPKSVGAWWVGADAINYMREKYGIIAVLQCADQFATDAYSLWGTPWSIPYIPSKANAAIPAQTHFDKQNNVVIMQWAPRDPLRAYGNSVEESKYSVQDMKFPEITYYDYLLSTYLQKPFDQSVVGLEGGLPPGSYSGVYDKQLQTIKTWQDAKKIIAQTSDEYAKSFLERGEALPPTHYFLTKDFKNDDQSFWYHSPYFRVGVIKRNESVYLVDYRDYQNTPSEDFSVLPNTQALIRINTKAKVDSVRFPKTEVLLATVKEPLEIKKENKKVVLSAGKKTLAEFTETSSHFNSIPEKSGLSKSFGMFRLPPIQPIIVVGILLGYILFLWFITKTNYIRITYLVSFFLGVLTITPILTNGLFFSDSYLFDSKFTSFIAFLSWLPVDPVVKIFLTYQLFPLLLLMVLHFILIKKITNALHLLAIFTLLLILSILYYSNFANELMMLVTLGKKGALASFGIVLISAFVVWQFIILLKTRSRKIVLLGISIILLLFLMIYKDTFITQKRIIITQFEMEALTVIAQQKKPVLNITTNFKQARSDYKDIFPIAFVDMQFCEWLTGQKWQNIQREEGSGINISNKNESSIAVPLYQGGFLYPGEEERFRLKRTFDNAHITIYISAIK